MWHVRSGDRRDEKILRDGYVGCRGMGWGVNIFVRKTLWYRKNVENTTFPLIRLVLKDDSIQGYFELPLRYFWGRYEKNLREIFFIENRKSFTFCIYRFGLMEVWGMGFNLKFDPYVLEHQRIKFYVFMMKCTIFMEFGIGAPYQNRKKKQAWRRVIQLLLVVETVRRRRSRTRTVIRFISSPKFKLFSPSSIYVAN